VVNLEKGEDQQKHIQVVLYKTAVLDSTLTIWRHPELRIGRVLDVEEHHDLDILSAFRAQSFFVQAVSAVDVSSPLRDTFCALQLLPRSILHIANLLQLEWLCMLVEAVSAHNHVEQMEAAVVSGPVVVV